MTSAPSSSERAATPSSERAATPSSPPAATPFERARTAEDAGDALARPGRDDAESEVVRELGTQVLRFCERAVDGARIDAAEALPAEALDGARALGLFGLAVPAEHGGAGLSMKATAHVVSALAAHDGSLATTVGLHAGLGLRALVAEGAPALQARWLPLAAAGTRIACFAATEPEAGSDLGAIRTVAAPHPEGGFVLDGNKIFVTNAGLGGFVTVLARAPGQGDGRHHHGLFLVDLASPGVGKTKVTGKLGLRGSSTVDLHFEGVRVPADHQVGRPGAGMEHAHAALTWGRTFLSAGCIGAARAAHALAVEHTARRRQFGRPLAAFELVRETLAESEARIFAMESVVRLVTELEDRAPGSVGWESSVAKVFCSEEGWRVVDRSLQLHGGMGYVEETGVARRLRDVRVTRIFEGANDVLRIRLAQAALTWPKEALAAPGRLAESVGAAEPLRALAREHDATWGLVQAHLQAAKASYGLRLLERQGLLACVADALVALYAAQAVLLRASGEVARAAAADERAQVEQATARAAAATGVCLEDVHAALGRLGRRLAAAPGAPARAAKRNSDERDTARSLG